MFFSREGTHETKRNDKKWQEKKRNEKKLRQWTNSEQKWKEMKTMNNKWKEMKRNETNEQKWKEMNTWKSFFPLFFPLGSRDSGITCFWLLILIDNMFLEIIFVFSFSFFGKKTKNIFEKQVFFLKKRESRTCCKGVSGAMCCGKIWDCLCVASVVKTKSVLIGHSLNRLNRMK